MAFTEESRAPQSQHLARRVVLSNQQTQLALRDGSAIFDVGYLTPGETFEVGTPYGAVDFNEPGLYNVGLDNGSVAVSVLVWHRLPGLATAAK